jgi:hypothetical protein
MSEILRFNVNIPAEVALRYGEGKRVQGRYGEQVMYTLVDDRVMYVPVCVGDRIGELQIRPGQPFEICKAEVRDGNRKWIEWFVRRLGDSPPPVFSSSTAVFGEPHNGRNGGANPSFRALRLESRSDGALLPVPVGGSRVLWMELSMNAAVEIAQRVEQRAALRDQAIHFTSEDVRAIALTMFIQTSREGGLGWSQ